MKITRDAIVSAGLFAMRAGSVVTTSAARAVVLAAVRALGHGRTRAGRFRRHMGVEYAYR